MEGNIIENTLPSAYLNSCLVYCFYQSGADCLPVPEDYIDFLISNKHHEISHEFNLCVQFQINPLCTFDKEVNIPSSQPVVCPRTKQYHLYFCSEMERCNSLYTFYFKFGKAHNQRYK